MSPCPPLSRGTQTIVPRRKPRKNPPKVRIWTMAPSRSPWTAASTISPMISKSTQSTAARVANGARENAAPTAILLGPCTHAPCFSSGVSGDAGRPVLILVALASPRRAVRCPGTRVQPKVPRVLGPGHGHPAGGGPAGPQRHGRPRSGVLCHGAALLGRGHRRPQPRPGQPGATVIAATTNGGTTWKAQAVSGGSTPQLSGVSCPAATECMAVGSNGASLPGSGVVITTSDAGVTWGGRLAAECARRAQRDLRQPDRLHGRGERRHLDLGRPQRRLRPELAAGGQPAVAFQPENDLTCLAGGICLDAGYIPTATATDRAPWR